MTEKDKGARPSQVTMAGWVALIGSALLVVTLFDSVSRLHTLEFRDSIDEFLSTPPGNGLGLSMGQVLEILRALMFLSASAAAAATVLAVFVLRRHNAARVGFTVAAAAIVLTTPVAGGFLGVMIAFSAILLWTRPARDWFAGRPVTTAANGRAGSQVSAFAAPDSRSRTEGNLVTSESDNPQDRPEDQGGEETSPWPRMPEGSSERPVPPPTQGFGSRTPEQGQAGAQAEGQQAPSGQEPGAAGPQGGQPPYAQPPYGQQGQQPPYGQQRQQPPYGQPPYGQPGQPGAQYGGPYAGQPPYGQPGYGRPAPAYPAQPPQQYYGAPQQPRDPDRRPTTVTVAAWITWILSGLTVLGFILIAIVMAAAQDEFVRQLEQDPDFQSLNVRSDQVVGAVWAMGVVALIWSIIAMVLAWFAFRRANWARITLVVSSAVTVLLSLLTMPVGLLQTLGAGAVIVLLFVGGANEWYSRRGATAGYQPGAFQPYGQPPQYGAPQPPYGQQQPGAAPGEYGAPQAGAPQQSTGEGDRDRKDEPPSNVW